ncbi:4'-phosphopantetheinyl transferase family protein, partial [Staphylococcus aureus]|uniref:4'-phosphopantetheinyl transferase family protein n=1 Tax=Staphylococcus aureus TaxID=1280 RepID=UPI0020265D48
ILFLTLQQNLSLKLPSALSFKDFKYAMNNISYSKRAIIERYIHKNDQLKSLLSDLLIRYIIVNKFQLKNNDLIFYKNTFGKPFLQNIPNFHYNISHSGNWIVCAIHSQQIGIDIEKIKHFDYGIILPSFSDYEKSYFTNISKCDADRMFFYIWTLKESYVKALGQGLYIPLNSFTIKNIASNIDISVHTNYYDTNFYFKKYYHNDYIISVCAKVNMFPNFIKEIDIEDILKLQ